jgi:hypothetical protein
LTDDFGKSFVSTKFVPQLFTERKKENTTYAAFDLLKYAYTGKNLKKCTIIGDGSTRYRIWLIHYAACWKIGVSIPDGGHWIFQLA